MGLERRLSRSIFLNTEVVQLRQLCLTPGGLFEPGQYLAEELPDIAFEMGLVEKLPPPQGRTMEPESDSHP
ncbi:MAG: hypothetical protein ACOYMP_13220 [Nodosilinea sp.]